VAGEFSGVDLLQLGGQEGVDQTPNRDPAGLRPRHSSDLQVIAFVQILVSCRVRIVPGIKVKRANANLLWPLADGVREQGKSVECLASLGSAVRDRESGLRGAPGAVSGWRPLYSVEVELQDVLEKSALGP
jgi:hypothetical protein